MARPKGKRFVPEFRPTYIEVIMDEGAKEMPGVMRRLMIKDIQYGANQIRIIVNK